MAVITGTDGAETLNGTDANDEIYGLGGDDTLFGGAGSDILDGGPGADRMVGGAGYDSYYVDNYSDFVDDTSGGGMVVTSVSYSLATGTYAGGINASRAAAGVAPINLTGSYYAEILYGNNGNNIIDAGSTPIQASTRDRLYGMGGNDTYIVYGNANFVYEDADAGFDTVLVAPDGMLSGRSYSLIDNVFSNVNSQVEVLAMRDAAATYSLDLSGNSYGQIIIGNAGANVLYGGAARIR